MYQINATDAYIKWFKKLKDRTAKVRILARLTNIESGSLGDTKPLDSNVSEFRIPYGPGYRVYYTMKQDVIVLLLIGGDKSTQKRDIEKAKALYLEWENKNESI